MNTRITEAAKALHTLTSISIRCYEDSQLKECYSRYDLPYDFMSILNFDQNKQKSTTAAIRWISKNHIFYFGYLCFGNISILMGPIKTAHCSSYDLQTAANELDPDQTCHEMITEALIDCPQMSIYSFLPLLTGTYQLMCFKDNVNKPHASTAFLSPIEDVSFFDPDDDSNPSYDQSLVSFFDGIIEQGDIAAMEEWFLYNPLLLLRISITGDTLEDTRLCFIISSTLFERAAVRGGLDSEHALRQQVNAIRTMENMDSEMEILQLQSELALEYTREVAALDLNVGETRLVRDAMRHVQRNLYSTLRVEDIAKSLGVSRGYLSKTFHAETGQSISSYITQKKIAEAKLLLRSSERSLSSISDLLKFSSQSHFTNVFKANTGMTPLQFRQRQSM